MHLKGVYWCKTSLTRVDMIHFNFESDLSWISKHEKLRYFPLAYYSNEPLI